MVLNAGGVRLIKTWKIDSRRIRPLLSNQPRRSNPFCEGFIFHPEILYGGGHVWAQPLDRLLRLGLDDMVSAFAIEADSVNIPPVGSTLKKGQILAEISPAIRQQRSLPPFRGGLRSHRDVEESPGLIWRDRTSAAGCS